MKCSSCGFENKSDVKFCVNCGAILSEKVNEAGRKIFCSSCGQENPPGSRFCQVCGSEILRAAGPVAPAPIPVSAPPKGRTPGWIWALISGLVVILTGAASLYLLSSKPAEVVPETETAVSDPGELVLPLAEGTCRPGEKLLYSEDFQDGIVANWPGIPDAQSFYSVRPAPDDAENLVLTIQKPDGTSGQVQAGPRLMITPFSNAVLRIRLFISKDLSTDNSDWFSFNWLAALEPFTLEGQQVYDSRYQLPIGWNYFEMRRLQQPVSNVSVARTVNPSSGEWHSLEIATYQPRTEVWLDGQMVMEYKDPKPLPAGTFALEAWLGNPQVKLIFDDISICELNAPYSP